MVFLHKRLASIAVFLSVIFLMGCDATSPGGDVQRTNMNAPVLLAPLEDKAMMSTDPFVFRWTSVPEAVGYELEIRDESENQEPLVFRSANPAFTVALEQAGGHTWRVRGFDDLNRVGYWSESRRIDVVSTQ